jgi:hypothetical protein
VLDILVQAIELRCALQPPLHCRRNGISAFTQTSALQIAQPDSFRSPAFAQLVLPRVRFDIPLRANPKEWLGILLVRFEQFTTMIGVAFGRVTDLADRK